MDNKKEKAILAIEKTLEIATEPKFKKALKAKLLQLKGNKNILK